jgi:hypothetical protein
MNISKKTIPFKEMRYKTLGDYWIDDQGDLQLRVAEFKDKRVEFLIILHELTELMLVLNRGISIESIDKFDIQFEKDRSEGLHSPNEEPGDHISSPYKKEHFFATNIERLMAEQLDFDWVNWDEEPI